MSILPDSYPSLNVYQLKQQLDAYYKNPSMQFDSLVELHKYLRDSNKTTSFDALFQLVEILLTTPMTTADPERKYSRHFRRGKN